MKKQTGIDRLSVCMILSAGICWGVIGLFSSQLAGYGYRPADIAFFRCTVSGLCLWGYIFLKKDRRGVKIDPRDLWMFAGAGIAGIAAFNIFYFTTIGITGLSVAVVLLYTAPFFVILLSALLFREKFTLAKAAACVLAFLGCLFITGVMGSLVIGAGPSAVPLAGILTGLGSGICYALFTVFSNIALKRYSSVTVTAYTFLAAALALLPMAVLNLNVAPLRHGKVLLLVLLIGVLSTLVPFSLYTRGLRHVEPGRAAVLALSEPLTSSLVGIFFLHEPISLSGVAGILLLIASMLILNLGRGAPVCGKGSAQGDTAKARKRE